MAIDIPRGAPDGGPDARPDGRVATQLELPWRTIVRVLLLFAVLWLILRLWEIGLQLLPAVLLAAALEPVVRWLQRRRVPRPLAVGIVVGGIVAVTVLIVALLVPPLVDEARAFAADLPDRVEDYGRVLRQNTDLYERLQSGAQSASADPSSLLGGVLAVGQGLVTADTTAFILLVLTIYILLDGARIYAWLVRYLPREAREKLDRTVPEVIKVINGYVVGQLITSALFGVFTFALLTAPGVPQPLFLAVVAAIADAIPIAGVIIATVPAVLLALTVSPAAAVAVLVAYLIYQQVENYVIVPAGLSPDAADLLIASSLKQQLRVCFFSYGGSHGCDIDSRDDHGILTCWYFSNASRSATRPRTVRGRRRRDCRDDTTNAIGRRPRGRRPGSRADWRVPARQRRKVRRRNSD
jgi:predicted PurR-regulated permease PerM